MVGWHEALLGQFVGNVPEAQHSVAQSGRKNFPLEQKSKETAGWNRDRRRRRHVIIRTHYIVAVVNALSCVRVFRMPFAKPARKKIAVVQGNAKVVVGS